MLPCSACARGQNYCSIHETLLHGVHGLPMGSLRKAEVEIVPGKSPTRRKSWNMLFVSHCAGDQPKLEGMGGMGEGTLLHAGNKSHEK